MSATEPLIPHSCHFYFLPCISNRELMHKPLKVWNNSGSKCCQHLSVECSLSYGYIWPCTSDFWVLILSRPLYSSPSTPVLPPCLLARRSVSNIRVKPSPCKSDFLPRCLWYVFNNRTLKIYLRNVPETQWSQVPILCSYVLVPRPL